MSAVVYSSCWEFYIMRPTVDSAEKLLGRMPYPWYYDIPITVYMLTV